MEIETLGLEDKVRYLSTMTDRDEVGRHFTDRYPDAVIAALEEEGLISIHRPVHDATGLPYSQEHWQLAVTDAGVELVEAYPGYHERD